MSSFGHGVVKNPIYGSNLFEDPAHAAAGKVLEENRNTMNENSLNSLGMEKQKYTSRLSFIVKLVLLFVFLVSVTAIVLVLLLVTSKIGKISDGRSSQQQGMYFYTSVVSTCLA
jgi:hypothetical protein